MERSCKGELEAWAREKMQQLLQEVLEEEVGVPGAGEVVRAEPRNGEVRRVLQWYWGTRSGC